LAIEDALAGLGRTARRDDKAVQEVTSQALRRVARSMFGLRPIAHVHILRLRDADNADVA
jgi:hypothetical protein